MPNSSDLADKNVCHHIQGKLMHINGKKIANPDKYIVCFPTNNWNHSAACRALEIPDCFLEV